MSKSPDGNKRLRLLTMSGAALAIGVGFGSLAASEQSGDASDGPPSAAGALLGLGRAAHPDEIAAWDVDIRPDGRGLPEGSGDVRTGDEVFAEKCASCHGDFAEGRDAWPPLAGGFGTLDDADPVKTVGSYWPYLSTVWDYVHRSMPFGNAGTLTDDEAYAITAYILYSNDLVDEDFTLSKETFSDVEMPNSDGFIVDDRPQAEYSEWRTDPCMQNCKNAVPEITRRATDVGVTPADDGSMAESVMEKELAAMGGEEWGKEVVAGSVYMMQGAAPAADAATGQPDTAQAAAEEPAADLDPQLVAAGEQVFRKCKACHAIGPGARSKTGPHLNDIFGRVFGGLDDFRYSKAFQDAAEDGRVWDEANLAEFLANPRGYIKGTKMSFAGLRQAEDVEAVIAYLKSASE